MNTMISRSPAPVPAAYLPWALAAGGVIAAGVAICPTTEPSH
jgi:hypothetical protein